LLPLDEERRTVNAQVRRTGHQQLDEYRRAASCYFALPDRRERNPTAERFAHVAIRQHIGMAARHGAQAWHTVWFSSHRKTSLRAIPFARKTSAVVFGQL
jgi:hypothetical protein